MYSRSYFREEMANNVIMKKGIWSIYVFERILKVSDSVMVLCSVVSETQHPLPTF